MKKKALKQIVFTIIGVSTLSVFYTNCSSSDSSGGLGVDTTDSAPQYSNPLPIVASQPNVMSVSVGCGYVNEPCVSVTVCMPGTNTCQTIPNILLDTGSVGLRLFDSWTPDWQNYTSLLNLPLIQDPVNNVNTLAECVTYVDSSGDWGPLAKADIQLGQETAKNVSVQIINANFANVPSPCSSANGISLDMDAIDAGFNGILGVGLFVKDCGSGCVGTANIGNNIYFSCAAGGSCNSDSVSLSRQVTNPVAALPKDNNGGVLALPNTAGATSLSGFFVLGIGTESNNSPAGTSTYATDSYGNFQTTFNGSADPSTFIDSGSNGLYFPQPPGLDICSDDNNFYCPSNELGFTAVQSGALGTPTTTVSFFVGNADNELSESNPNIVFNDLAGPLGDFDWGLPFFMGRNIFVGIEGKTSNAGTGPYWTY